MSHEYPTSHAAAHESALQKMTVHDLKEALKAAHIDIRSFKDKDELVQACLDNKVVPAHTTPAPAPAPAPTPQEVPVQWSNDTAPELAERHHGDAYPPSHASVHDDALARHKVSELKALLKAKNIDFSGCMDKDEIVRLAVDRGLHEEDFQNLKASSAN